MFKTVLKFYAVYVVVAALLYPTDEGFAHSIGFYIGYPFGLMLGNH